MTDTTRADIRATINRFSVGDAQVTTILDGAQMRPALKPPFVLDKSDDEIAKIGRANRLPVDCFENTFTPTVVDTGSEVVLFDVGFGEMGRDNGAGHLRARLQEAGYAPEDIDIVALTHCHPDHIAGLFEDGDLAYPKAQLMIGQREFDAWTSGEGIPEQRAANRELFQKLITPIADRFKFLEDGDAVARGLTAEAAFGHSLGHMMYRLETGGTQILIWGDVTNHYVFSLQYPDALVGFDDDKPAAADTRRRVLDMAATDDLLVVGHHMPFPAIGFVERSDTSFRWVPASYQTRVTE